MKRTLCPYCRQKLEPGQRIHPECIDGYAAAQEAKAKRKSDKQARAAAKVQRAEIKRRKEAIKTIPQLIREAQCLFNRYIRLRDAGKPCISCGAPLLPHGVGGGFDAGHYRSTGSASHLRFHEDNCHGQCKQCNRWGAGRAVDYRIGLANRIGLERVEALESMNTPHKWTADELRELRDFYKQKCKELEG